MAYCPSMKSLSSPRRLYIPARGLATALALGFALLYSRQLGVTNRGFIAAIMTFSVVTLILITSGTTLTLRNLAAKNEFLSYFYGFKTLIAIELSAALVLFIFEILIFSTFKNEIPLSLFLISIVYFIACGMHLVFMEILLALHKFKIVSQFEILTVILQITFFLIFSQAQSISIAIRLLLSMSIAYIIISGLIVFNLRSSIGSWRCFSSPQNFLKKSKGNHSIGGVLGLVDRFDRVIISWLLPVSVLAQYSVMSSFIAFFRFLPDAYAKVLVSLKMEKLGHLQSKRFLLESLAVCALVMLIFLSRVLIERLLGPGWLLPLGVSVLFSIQELARGRFQVSGTEKISLGNSAATNRASLFLGLFAVPLSIIATLLLGVYGVPLGFILTYVTLLCFLNYRKVVKVV
jgi:hypothetical protein